MENISIHVLSISKVPAQSRGTSIPVPGVTGRASSYDDSDGPRSTPNLGHRFTDITTISGNIRGTCFAFSRSPTASASASEGDSGWTACRGERPGRRRGILGQPASRCFDSANAARAAETDSCFPGPRNGREYDQPSGRETCRIKATAHFAGRYQGQSTFTGLLAALPLPRFGWIGRGRHHHNSGHPVATCAQFIAAQFRNLPSVLSLCLILSVSARANEESEPTHTPPAHSEGNSHSHSDAASEPVHSSPQESQSGNHHPVAAEEAAPSAVDSYRKEGRSLIKLGASLTERGDFAAAEIAYRRIMNDRHYAEAEQKEALLGLARMYRHQTVFTKAVAVYEKFLKIYPDDARVPDALLELGRSQRAMGAYRNAINRFYSVINSTLKLPPESYEHYQLLAKTAQFEIAETHFEMGNFKEAAKFYDRLRLLDLAPEDRARAHFKAACSLLNAGEHEAATAKLNQYLEQWPGDTQTPEAQYLLALTLRKLGRTEEALRITLSLLRNQQTNANSDPKAWAYWQRRTGNQLANEFFQNGDTLSAVTIYESLISLSQENSWRLPIIYQTGLCYERLRQGDRATKAYRDIIDAVTNSKTGDQSSELTELARMATWRIGQIDWSGQTENQLHQFFSATLPAPPAKPPPKPTPSVNDADTSTPTASGSM